MKQPSFAIYYIYFVEKNNIVVYIILFIESKNKKFLGIDIMHRFCDYIL